MGPPNDGKTHLGWQERLVGVWCVRLLLVVLLAGLLLLLIWFLPVRLEVQFRQQNGQAALWAQVAVAWWKRSRTIQLTEQLAGGREQGQQKSRSAGRRFPGPGRVWKQVEKPVRWLLRRLQCRRLDLQVVVGGADAMESALLAGCVHALLGAGLGFLSHWIRLPRSVLRIEVVPSFHQPALRVRGDCILVIRLGEAIAAGVWSIRQVRRDPVLSAWLMEQRRSKGVEGVVRTSDSKPDEDSNGKLTGHGGREYRGG